MSTTSQERSSCLTLDTGLTVRPWVEGDDLKLLEVWGDPENSMQHVDRALLRPSSNQPWSRCIVAEDHGVPVAAATVFKSSLHPDRLSFYAEVAPEHRRRGIANQLLEILEAEMPNCTTQNLKARCAKNSAAQCFLKDNGFEKIHRSRHVTIQPGTLKLPDLENSGLDVSDIATGSVELSQLVSDFYNSVHNWDRSEMTVGKAQQFLLDERAGASGAVVLRESSEAGSGRILAFAISYTFEQSDDPADVLLGWNPELSEEESEAAAHDLLAVVTARYPVTVEVNDSMAPLKKITDTLTTNGDADSDFVALIYVRDQ